MMLQIKELANSVSVLVTVVNAMKTSRSKGLSPLIATYGTPTVPPAYAPGMLTKITVDPENSQLSTPIAQTSAISTGGFTGI